MSVKGINNIWLHFVLTFKTALKNDPKKAFCQTVRFTMRLKKKMKSFKERKMNTYNFNDNQK